MNLQGEGNTTSVAVHSGFLMKNVFCFFFFPRPKVNETKCLKFWSERSAEFSALRCGGVALSADCAERGGQRSPLLRFQGAWA